jgi:hypothetical protein
MLSLAYGTGFFFNVDTMVVKVASTRHPIMIAALRAFQLTILVCSNGTLFPVTLLKFIFALHGAS